MPVTEAKNEKMTRSWLSSFFVWSASAVRVARVGEWLAVFSGE